MRITQNNLKTQVANLNKISKQKYDVEFAYGKARLVRRVQCGGYTAITGYSSKSELYRIMQSIESYNWQER